MDGDDGSDKKGRRYKYKKMKIEVLQPGNMHVREEKAQSLTPHLGSKRSNRRKTNKIEPVLSESGKNKRRRNAKTSQKNLNLVHVTQSSLSNTNDLSNHYNVSAVLDNRVAFTN